MAFLSSSSSSSSSTMQKGIVVTVPVLVLTASFSAVIFFILSSSLSSCSCPSSITFQNDAVFATVNDGDVMLSEKISTSREDIDWVIDLIRSNGLHMQDNVLRKGINPRTREQQLQDLIQ